MKTKEEQINEIYDQYIKDLEVFEVCELGSCQYKTIEDTYKWALALMKLLGLENFEKLLDIGHEGYLSKDEYEADLFNYLMETTDEEEQKEFNNLLDYDNKRVSIKDFYKICRDLSYDLWSAARCPIINIEIRKPIDLPTRGPIFNQMAQSENFEIGICLAYDTFLFNTELSFYADFDT